MTPAASGGFDLSWIECEDRRLVCRGCGKEQELSAECSTVLVSVFCEVFIERHARCGRSRRMEVHDGRRSA